MNLGKVARFLAVAACAGSLTAGSALAGAGMSCSMTNAHIKNGVANPPRGDGVVTLLKDGKFSAKPSTKGGDGGASVSLTLGTVDCPPSNAGGLAGKCDGKNHVLELVTDFGGLETHVGVLYDVVGGKAIFPVSGTSKASGNQLFGPLVTALSQNPVAIGIVKAHAPGTTPADCATVPLEFKPGQKCTDGKVYAVCGFVGGLDPAPNSCASDTQCSGTQVCVGGVCTCTKDSDCRSFTGAGSTVTCNENTGDCCFPGATPADPNCDID